MSDLVSLTDAKTFLEISVSTDDALLTDLLEHLEGLFEANTGRKSVPFTAAATARSEVKDGTGSRMLYLDYTIADVTSISLGFDSSDFVETLDPDDPDVVVWGVGSRIIERVDGGRFGAAGAPRYVTVVYNHQADLPQEAQIAIKRLLSQVYRQRGSEDATREEIGNYTRTLSKLVDTDPIWESAVTANRRMALA